MPSSLLDVCRYTPTAGGTTDWTFSAAVQGYQSPAAAGVVNGATYSYRAESADLSQWEIGTGTYNTSTGVLTRTTVLFNSAGTTAKINFTSAPQVAIVALAEDIRSARQTRTVLTSGSGTYTVPTGCKAILVRMAGGGGGGGGGNPTPANGGTGGNTTFGTSLLQAGGGGPGQTAGGGVAAGGSSSGGDINIDGTQSTPTFGAGGYASGTGGNIGIGGPFGGAGYGGWQGGNGGTGKPNSGGGGGGGGGASSGGGGGGGGGGYCEKLIVGPAATYAYSIGAGGSGGTSGGNAGGAGGSGVIIIDEYY